MPFDENQKTLEQISKIYAENTKRIIVFTGAGCSKSAGLPLWAELREILYKNINHATDNIVLNNEMIQKAEHLEKLYNSENFWDFFDYAQIEWKSTYDETLEENIALISENCVVPEIYNYIWNMKHVKQVFTLNLDGLASRAFRNTIGNTALFEYDGFNMVDSKSFLDRNLPCVFNVHGIFNSKSRWIMNTTERNRLYDSTESEKFRNFIKYIFSNYTVLFIGINPKDYAVSPFLKETINLGMAGKHFWITSDTTSETHKWCEASNIRPIHYKPEIDPDKNQKHEPTIINILDYIEKFTSRDRVPILPACEELISPDGITTAEDMSSNFPNSRASILRQLNGAISYLIENHGYNSRILTGFINEYDIPIQFSANIGKSEPYNTIGSASVVDRLQSHGSSTVWMAKADRDPLGTYCAVKILSNVNFHNEMERNSFRRGIESLYLLKDSELDVAPKYISHTEIPLSVTMSYISGGAIEDFMRNSNYSFFPYGALLFKAICETIHKCHKSKDGILHRDINPPNIILEDWYVESELSDYSVKLINFDLSWHKFASGDTKNIGAKELGYYAPEQKNSMNALPSRTAGTDIYMLGMILYYIVTGSPPPEGGSNTKYWAEEVSRLFRGPLRPNEFEAKRLQRLVVEMTRENSEERPDVISVLSEIQGIVNFNENRFEYVDPDYFVEALCCSIGRGYEWDSRVLCGRINAAPEKTLTLQYQPKGQRIEFSFSRSRSEADERGSFGSRVREKMKEATRMFEDAGWVTETGGGVIKSLSATRHLIEHKNFRGADIELLKSISGHLLATSL